MDVPGCHDNLFNIQVQLYFFHFFIPGDPKGRHVIIVDDLIQTGGTIKNCAKVSIVIVK